MEDKENLGKCSRLKEIKEIWQLKAVPNPRLDGGGVPREWGVTWKSLLGSFDGIWIKTKNNIDESIFSFLTMLPCLYKNVLVLRKQWRI